MKRFPPPRPLSVTITTLGVFLFGLLNLWRAVGLARQTDLLLEWSVSLDPRIRMGVALIWVFLFLAASVALWQRQPFSRLAIPVLLLLYAIYQLGLLLFFVQSPVARQGWLLDITLYTAVILFSWWILNRPAVQTYFEDQDQKPELKNGTTTDPNPPIPNP